MCDIEEQNEAKNLTESLNFLSNQICKDARQLCVIHAARVGCVITQEVVDQAESVSKCRFDKISGDLVENVRSRRFPASN